MSWEGARRLRQVVRILFFALFVYLSFAAFERYTVPPLADIFFRLDPLAALGAMLAKRAWIPRLGLALVTLGLTLVVGRAWCGWVCPLGTLLEWVTFRRARQRAAALSPRLRKIKYILLVAIMTLAILGNLTLFVFDPMAVLTRTMTTAVIPAITYATNTIERALYPVRALRPALDWFEGMMRGSVLPVEQPAFAQNVAITALFIVILGLNTLAPLFWCRYLCPLGALLGLLAKVSLLRPLVGSACTGCQRCARVCRPGAIDAGQLGDEPHRPEAIKPSECTVCLDCLAGCEHGDIRFHALFRPAPAQAFDLSRREALGALAAGAAGLLLLRTDLRARRQNPWLIRPPGVTHEGDFLARCLRCAQCMEVCPTTALQPALAEAGLEGLWTPLVIPRVGYCDYGCNACGQACPSGAIPSLSLAEKRQAVMGLASVDRDRCLPWTSSVPCIVCEEMCPTPQKSIRLEEAHVAAENGETVVLQRPYVLSELCIGCGICEGHCPLEGEAAIRVHSG